MSPHCLVLGGTQDARSLCLALAEFPAVQITLSLAGALGETARESFFSRMLPSMTKRISLRVGGFGGVDGLARYISEQNVSFLVDATHPYAARMSAHAVEAARKTGVKIARLERPPWRRHANEMWIEADDLFDAARKIPFGATCLLAVGRQSLLPFHPITHCRFAVRSIAPSDLEGFRAPVETIQSLPGASVGAEESLMRDLGITCLVSKNSGGERAFHKVAAAHNLGLDIVMVARPSLPQCRQYCDVKSLMEELISHFGAD